MKKTKVKSQNVLTGALILLLATVAVKLIGAFFKIPLTNLIGGTGMGYFMTAYGMFNPIYSLSIAGMPVAVSRLVAENMAMQRYRDVKKLMKAARLLFFAAGTVGCLVMLFGSGLFVEAVGNPYALYPVMAMAPAVFFGCMMSAYRGYYEGMRNMNPTALSQVIEAVVKLLFGYLAAKWILASASAQYAQSGTVFWITPASAEEAHNLILSFSATGAMLGVTASCAAGMAFVVLRHLIIGDGISKQQLLLAPAPASGGELLKKLARIAIPVCIASVVTSLTSLIDLGSVMNRLSTALSRDSVTMLSGYAGAIPTDMALADIPNYLYGSYQALAVNLFHLVPALCVPFGTSALPSVASAWTTGNHPALRRNIESVLKLTAIVALPAGLGIAVLAEPILTLLYPARTAEIMIAAPLLRLMGISAIFVALTSPTNSMLQAIGRQDLPVKLILLGAGIKLTINWVLIAQPGINILGAPVGSIACYAVMAGLSIFSLIRRSQTKLSLCSVLLRPALAAGLCAVGAWVSYSLLIRVLTNSPAVLLSIAVAAAIYFVALFACKAVGPEEIRMLPKGEKILLLLEKKGIIG